MEYFEVFINLFLGMQGFAFVVYLFLSGTIIKATILRIKTTEGEVVYDDERGDMGGKALFMGPCALLCLIFFYRPIFYYKTARKIKSLYGTGNPILTDVFGIYLPIAFTVIIFPIITFAVTTRYYLYETLIYLPILASEVVAAIMLSRASKKNFVMPDARLSEN